jgi:uncharacterized membrane protein YqaE (UPF0057 family)
VSGVWAGILIPTLGLGFAVGHLRDTRVRRLCLTALLTFPGLVLAVGLALAPPRPETLFDWWGATLAMEAPVLLAWIVLSTAAFIAGRWSVR